MTVSEARWSRVRQGGKESYDKRAEAILGEVGNVERLLSIPQIHHVTTPTNMSRSPSREREERMDSVMSEDKVRDRPESEEAPAK